MLDLKGLGSVSLETGQLIAFGLELSLENNFFPGLHSGPRCQTSSSLSPASTRYQLLPLISLLPLNLILF